MKDERARIGANNCPGGKLVVASRSCDITYFSVFSQIV
jgi:hypothetical protein